MKHDLNRVQIDEIFEAYIFNLVNSDMEIMFFNIEKMKHAKKYNVDWGAPCIHDDYIKDKVDIKSEEDRKISMGIDVFDNGTYWAFPMRYEDYRGYHTLFGGTHRFFSLMKIKELNMRDFTNRKFLCYNVQDGIDNLNGLIEEYGDCISKYVTESMNFEQLEKWMKNRHTYIDTYYIISKEQWEHNSSRIFFNVRNIKIDLTKELCDIVGEFGDNLDFYIIKSIKYLDYFNDNLVYCKNDINHLNKTGDRIHPHKMVSSEEEFEKHKHKYVFDEFIKRNKDKVKFY